MHSKHRADQYTPSPAHPLSSRINPCQPQGLCKDFPSLRNRTSESKAASRKILWQSHFKMNHIQAKPLYFTFPTFTVLKNCAAEILNMALNTKDNKLLCGFCIVFTFSLQLPLVMDCDRLPGVYFCLSLLETGLLEPVLIPCYLTPTLSREGNSQEFGFLHLLLVQLKSLSATGNYGWFGAGVGKL